MIAGDQLSVVGGVGSFLDPSLVMAKTVTITGLSLGGVDSQIYILLDPTAKATASIGAIVAQPLAPQQVANTDAYSDNGAKPGSPLPSTFTLLKGGPDHIDVSQMT